MNAWADRARYAGIAAGSFGLVVGASFATTVVSGLVHERDMLRNEVQALEQHPHEPSLAPTSSTQPSAQPTAPAAGPAPGSSSPTPTPRVLQVVAAPTSSNPAAAPGPSRPAPSPAPSPTASPPSRCPVATVATVRLPVGVLPCSTIVVGGTG